MAKINEDCICNPITKNERLNWAEREFISSDIGDKRLNNRLKVIAKAFFEKPNANIPLATGSWKGAKGAYRFFSNKKVTPDKIINPHKEASKERIANYKTILAIQDTSVLDYTNHPKTDGLGPAGNLHTFGLLLHPTLAVTTTGIPLGLIDYQIWSRELSVDEVKEKNNKSKTEKEMMRKNTKIEDKESYKWIESYKKTKEFQNELSDVNFVNVCDREGDFYDFFREATKEDTEKKPDVLVRVAHLNRRVEGKHAYLLDEITSLNKSGYSIIQVPRQKDRKTREAKLSIRYGEVTILPPKIKRVSENPKPIKLWAILADEENCPNDCEKISWILFTTISIHSLEDAIEKINWYKVRWVIEIFFKVLKSGCTIEERQLETAERLKSCIAVDCVIAWRILFLTLVGREVPDLPASVIFDESEWISLYCFINSTSDPPNEEPELQVVVRQIASLGGFLGRKSDGEPGIVTLWRGMWRMIDIAAAYRLFSKNK